MKIIVIHGVEPIPDHLGKNNYLEQELDALEDLLQSLNHDVEFLPEVPATWHRFENDPDFIYDWLIIAYPSYRPDSDLLSMMLDDKENISFIDN